MSRAALVAAMRRVPALVAAMRRVPALVAAAIVLTSGFFASGFVAAGGAGGKDLDGSAADIAIELRRLETVGAALYIAAHPDDENTALLAYWARGRNVRAGYLSLTRGGGGQNLIGHEKGPFLGVLRTQELLAARRIDGAEQFFTRADDFGYSKSPEETVKIWGREAILGDVVWTIRRFQPDVIVTRFPKNGDGGHGHHTASAILAEEAFTAAADASRYPEHLQYVKPWQAKRLAWNSFRPGRDPAADTTGLLKVDLGAFNPILGKSYTEIAGESRSQHKSQGFGSPERRGSRFDYFQVLAGEPAKEDLFEGIDLTWRRIPGGEAVGEHVAAARKALTLEDPSKAIPELLAAHAALEKLPSSPTLDYKREQLTELVRKAAGLVLDANVARASAAPGSSVDVNLTAVSRCGLPITVELASPPFGGESTLDKPRKLVFNQPAQATAKFTVPGYITYTQPLWHPMRAIEDRLLLLGDRAGLAEEPRPLACTWRVDVGGTILTYSTPLVHRVVDPVKGEVVEPFRIVPALTLAFDRAVDLYPIGAHKSGQIGVVVENGDAAQEGTLTLEGPPGWTIRDNPRPFKLAPRESKRFDFEYEPGEKPSSGDWTAVADAGGRSHREGVVKIDYPHITPQRLYVYATAKLIASDIRRNGVRAGYIEGSGDDVPQALRELGFDVTFLDDEALTSADLSKLDVIVGGVRAYNTRPKLATAQPRLLEYVANGGTLVLQYNTLQELTTRALGPYPFEVSRERVTVEDSPVAFPDPEHPLLTKPNKITAADFEGWVQERGLYFAGKWDPKYSAPLEMADPGESKRLGSVLYVNYGKGVYIYTSLSLFRQLPEGVVGAYRLFANMVSARAQE